MKKFIIMLQSILVCVALVFVGMTTVAQEVGVSAQTIEYEESTNVVYSNDFYTLVYENNEVKLLLNSDLTVYKDLRPEDAVELKDALIRVAYSAILDDLDINLSGSKGKKGNSVGSHKNGVSDLVGAVDISLITELLGGQLIDEITIDEAIYGSEYDTLLQFYVDRYTHAYIEANNADFHETLDKVEEQLIEAVQDAVVKVYEDKGQEEYAPTDDAEDKVVEIVDFVRNSKNNNEKITADLGDVQKIIEKVDDTEVLIDIINQTKISSEIKEVINNSTPEQTTEFFTKTDMNTIIDIYEHVEVSKEDVKEIVSNIGAENLVEIIDKVGMDSMQDLANSVGLTKDDLKDVIKDNIATINIATLVKSVKSIAIDGNKIYSDAQVHLSALEPIIKGLPTFSEIANFTDEEMNLSWNLAAETVFGTIEFDLTIGLKGDCSKIRTVAQILADTVNISYTNGIFNLELIAPDKLADVYLRLCNTGLVSDEIKHSLFDNVFGTVDNLYNNLTDKTLEDYLEVLKSVDYKVIVGNLYNAENLNKLFRTDKITDERLDKLVNAVCALVHKAASLTYADVKAFVNNYADISILDNETLEQYVNKVFDVIKKIDAKELDAALLREFIDPNSQYTNDNIDQYIDRLSRFENYFDKLMEYFEKAYNKFPDRFKDNSVLDFYLGDGSFNFAANLDLDYEAILTSINSEYGAKLYEVLNIVLDKMPDGFGVNVSVNLSNINKVTYNFEDKVVEGMLPTGADLVFFGNTEVLKWVDVDGNEYDTMPNYDVELFPIYDFEATIENGVEKEYDGIEEVLEVKVSLEGEYTYQWYKDGVLVGGATEKTLKVVDVADSGLYYCVVTSASGVERQSNTVEVIITKAKIDASELEWDYSNPFTYDGTPKKVLLKDEKPGLLYVTYFENEYTNAYKYIAYVELALVDEFNYEIVGSVPSLEWEIQKAQIDVSGFTWDQFTFTYDGHEKEVLISNLTADVVATYKNNKFTDAGEYVASVTFEAVDSENYEIIGTVADLEWEIQKALIDVTGYEWEYDNNIVYNGSEQIVVLKNNYSELLTPVYSGNAYTNAGTYTASVTFTVTDSKNFEVYGTVADLEWEIKKVQINVSGLTWNYSGPFTYDGTLKEVKLSDSISEITTTYSANTATNAGTYTASVTFSVSDTVNYEVIGTVADLEWEIKKATIEITELVWNYSGPFTYDGTEKKVELTNVPAGLLVNYANNAKTNVGVYTATATLTLEDSDNYELVGTAVSTLEWEIKSSGSSQTKNLFEIRDESGVLLLSVSAANGLDGDVQVSYKEIDFKDLDVDFSEMLEEGKLGKIVAAYDITFTDKEGNVVEVSDDFTVQILIPEKLRKIEDLRIAHISTENVPTDMEGTREGDYMTFHTTHFSIYSMVKVYDEPSYAWLIWLIIILAIIIVILIILLVLQYKNQPVKEEAAPVEEAAPAEVVEEAIPVVRIKKIKRKFISKLMVAPMETKVNYCEVKNYFLMYGAKSRLTNKCEIFRCEDVVAKVFIGGKALKIFLAIDPRSLENTKYRFKDYSDKKQYSNVPSMFKVRSARSLKQFKELIDLMMIKLQQTANAEYVQVDFVDELVPNGEAILGNLKLPAKCMMDSITINDIPEELPENLEELIYTVEAEALTEEALEANVYLDTLCNHFEDGDIIDIKVLKEKRIVRGGNVIRVKARGVLNKKFRIYAEEFDEKALKMLLCANCTPVKIKR